VSFSSLEDVRNHLLPEKRMDTSGPRGERKTGTGNGDDYANAPDREQARTPGADEEGGGERSDMIYGLGG
jgi:hypothetical protein